MKTNPKNRIESSLTMERPPETVWNTLVAISNYRSWNPVVTHAVMYGPVAKRTEIKLRSGKWDLNFIIADTSPPKFLRIHGGGIGFNINMSITVSPDINGSEIKIDAILDGWLYKLFSNKVKRGIEESLDIFLTSLRRRVLSDDSYEIERHDEKSEEKDDDRGRPSPTPFNLIYRTRKRKSRKGRSRLR